MIVLDASAAIEILLGTDAGRAVAAEVLAPSEDLHAPHLLGAEVAQGLRRLESRGEIGAARARTALGDLADLPIVFHPLDLLLARAWELRRNLTIYDAVYVVLSELLEAPLLTCDRRLARAPGHAARVRLI